MFHASERELLDVLVPFVRAGLEAREACSWEVRRPLAVDDVTAALARGVPGFAEYVARGQLEVVPAPEEPGPGAPLYEALERRLDRAILAGFEGLRVVCHAADRAEARALGAALDAAGRLNVLAALPFARAQLAGVELLDRVQEHRFALVCNSGRWEVLSGSAARASRDALERREERLQSLFGNTSEGFAYHRIVLDDLGRPRDYVFLEVNPAFERLTGLSADRIVGKRVTEVLPGIERDPTDWIGKYGRVALTGEPLQFEGRAEVLDRWYSVSAFSSRRGYFAVAFSDVTARRQADAERAASERALRASEARFRLLSDSAGLLLSTDDPQRVVSTLCRDVMEHLRCQVFICYLADPGAERLHLSAHAGIPEAEARRIERLDFGVAVCGCVARDRQAIVAEDVQHSTDRRFEIVRSYGVQAYCCHPLVAEGRLLGTLSFGSRLRSSFSDADVALMRTVADQVAVATERIQAQRALHEANQRLKDTDRRKDDFLAVLSHELRNPLAPIRNSLYILEHAAPGGEQAKRALDVIARQANHLARLVDDLLDVTRIARGKIELRRSRVDARDVVHRAAEDFTGVMADRGLAFRTVVPDRQVWIDADATRIAQIVGNLLHNAAKFTRAGDEVTLSLETRGGTAEIRVRDTGAGIDPVLLPNVFDAFVQGQRTLARTEGGLGLGLALVKSIAELHGGAARAESAGKGRGAEFIVALPLLAGEAAQPALPRPARARTSTGGRRVLVVDDNVDAADSLAEIVQMLGHAAEVAYDGPTAIAKARASPPDVVLCDIGLPGMSGYEVAQALRAAGNRAHMFALSGYAQPEDVKNSVAAGFDGHVAKPLVVEDLDRLLA
ncbi:MAG TPA: ATP-binding protein [Anaeromyxobacter sp.]|nr:ATP-binding protein [Anaeromyxobacter sp.]